MTNSPQGSDLSDFRLNITGHCIERYQQRFAQGLGYKAAHKQLERFIDHGRLSREPPSWLAKTAQQHAEWYLIIGDDLVLPLVQDRYSPNCYVALTCLGKGNISELTRKRRNAKARLKRAKKYWRQPNK